MNKKIEDLKVGDKFMMDGYTGNGEFIKTKCKLITYNGMNKYVVDNEGVTVLIDGDETVYPIVDEMVYESEIGKWVTVDEYQSYAYNYPIECSAELDNEWANESI